MNDESKYLSGGYGSNECLECTSKDERIKELENIEESCRYFLNVDKAVRDYKELKRLNKKHNL